MAENKKSFILYADLLNTFEELSNDEAGKLIKHILRYVNDLNPVTDDRLVKVAFEPIKQQLKRDLQKWDKVKVIKSEAGKKGMEKRWGKKVITDDNSVMEVITEITVNDNVNVNVNEEKGFAPIPKSSEDTLFTIEHCLTIALNDDRWVRANKATRTDLEAFNLVLIGRGIYNKNAGDYKTHYHNWKKGGGQAVPEKIKAEKTAPPLRRGNEVNL